MARKPGTLATLDIVAEGQSQADGLAERLARQRSSRAGTALAAEIAASHPETARNAWRQGKALVQIALPEDAHMELSILARRRRLTVSRLVRAALNEWLERHGHALRLPE